MGFEAIRCRWLLEKRQTRCAPLPCRTRRPRATAAPVRQHRGLLQTEEPQLEI